MRKRILTSDQSAEVLRLFGEGRSVPDLADQFLVSAGTVYRILHAGNATCRNRKVTAEETRTIVRLTREGKTQIEIGKLIGRSKSAVQAVKRRFKVRKWRKVTPEVEAQIMAVYRTGIGQIRTAKWFRVPEPVVRRIVHAAGITHQVGYLSLEKRDPKKYKAVVAAVRKRQDFCVGIGKKFGVNRDVVRRIAHAELGAGKFLSSWPPLSSHEPLRYPTPQLATRDFFVRIVRGVFPDKLPFPPKQDAHVVAMLNGLLHQNYPAWQSATPDQLVQLDLSLLEAISTVRAQGEGGWLN